MSRIGRRFVPQSTIDRRVQANDDRHARTLRARVLGVAALAVSAATHFCEYDRIQPGRRSIGLCGAWVEEAEISGAPTCPACQLDLARTAEEVFGVAPPFAALRPRLAGGAR